ncbi:pectinesterase family protein [Bacteroides ovatus]|nr:pectinesterase family protein [Bacteroides ovatus]
MKKIQCILQGVILLFSLCSPVWGADGRGLIDRNHSGESNSPFQAVVARDGSGDYRTVQEAVNAAPENSKTPWCIFVKNGSYREYLFIPKTKTFIHLIGQDKDKTIIHHSLNVGGKPEATSTDIDYWRYSVHNPESDVYKYDGSVVKIEAPDFYSENISYVNDWGVDSQKSTASFGNEQSGGSYRI